MQHFSFSYEKHPKMKGICPSCGTKNSFRFYEDEFSSRLDERYGKCERINNCAYHAIPSSNLDKIIAKKPSKANLIKKDAGVSVIYPTDKQCTVLESYLHDSSSDFHKYLLAKGITTEHLEKHGVGTDKNGKALFLYRSITNKVVNCKTVSYTDDGKRDKEVNAYSLKQPRDGKSKYSMCLFGEDLLEQTKTKIVIIVESEKTKVIASFHYPEYDWVACGSSNGLTAGKLKVLYGRKVIWLCDADVAGRQNSSINNLEASGMDFNVIDLFPNKSDGYDLADALLDGNIVDLADALKTSVVEKHSIYDLETKNVRYSRENKSMSVKLRNGWVDISDNFQVFIKYQTEDESENYTWILEIKIKDKATIYIEVSHDDFCSSKKLKNLLAGKHLSYKVQDNQHTEIQNALFRKTTYGRARKMVRFGYDVESNAYFFSNKVLVNNADLLEPDEFGIVVNNGQYLSKPLSNKKSDRRFFLSDFQISFSDWFQVYQQAHTYESAIIPVCFYTMSLFRDIVVKHTNTCPIMLTKGSAGTGKSSANRSITCLFGYKQDDINLKSENTNVAIIKLMSQFANVMLWMDEYHNELSNEGLLQAAYDNTGYHKTPEFSKSSNDTQSIDIHAALALTSNFFPKNPIFFSRCVLVQMEKSEKTAEQIIAFKQLHDLEQNGLGMVSVELLKHRELIVERYDETYQDLEESLMARLEGEQISVRLFANMCQVLTCAVILHTKGVIAICESTVYEDILLEFTEIGVNNILKQNTIQNDNSILTEFFGIVQMLVETNQLLKNVHYRFIDGMINLRIPSIYTTIARAYRQTYHKSAPDRDTILQEILKLEKNRTKEEILTHGRFREEKSDSATLKITLKNCWLITYEIYQSRYGLDLESRIEK